MEKLFVIIGVILIVILTIIGTGAIWILLDPTYYSVCDRVIITSLGLLMDAVILSVILGGKR